ncbi:5-methylcytosine-specific restriction endonuclease McrA [Sphingomonas sp. F9_3S_D5_B_2]
MPRPLVLTRYLNPWKFRRQEREQRVQELRGRDGDNCTRCRRPMRFDLPDGHDQAANIEHVVPIVNGGASEPGNQCLCHGRCAGGADHTAEVQERRRRENEAKLLSRARPSSKAKSQGSEKPLPR